MVWDITAARFYSGLVTREPSRHATRSQSFFLCLNCKKAQALLKKKKEWFTTKKKKLHFTVSKKSRHPKWKHAKGLLTRGQAFPLGSCKSRPLAPLCSGLGSPPSSWQFTGERPEPQRCPSSCRSWAPAPSGSCSQQAGWGSSSWVVPAHSASSGTHTPLPMSYPWS